MPSHVRNRRRTPFSEIIFECPDGTKISKRDLQELRERARTTVFGGKIDKLAYRLEGGIPKPQYTFIEKWMREVNGRRKFTDEIADELVATLILQAAERLKTTPAKLYRQISVSAEARDTLILRRGCF